MESLRSVWVMVWVMMSQSALMQVWVWAQVQQIEWKTRRSAVDSFDLFVAADPPVRLHRERRLRVRFWKAIFSCPATALFVGTAGFAGVVVCLPVSLLRRAT